MARPVSDAPPGEDADRPGFRPLYRQVRDALIRRLVDGVWLPGQPLPSEIQLAAELGVSQGTVRKALDAMAAENMVVRRQGRGTFVARHDDERILFQFFKLVPDSGRRSFPQSTFLDIATGEASGLEAGMLQVPPAAPVVRLRRVRSLEDRPAVVERIVLPHALFPGIAEAELPNNLYGLYAMRYGITVGNAREKIKAVAIEADDAAALGVAPGTPVLWIDRIALSLDGVAVEWRMSVCLTSSLHYLSDLR
ncbi:GntR family transcriptional regulator [Ancylobacter terrae]|uniref:GntR family transcriptional regulator n=1 Tax=Ancylobacter sp. sgz301288 TaxID=3342077 RepID=UPI003859389C